MDVCSVSGCDRKQHSSGLCGSHYQRKRRTGSTSPLRPIGEGAGLLWLKKNSNPDHNDCVVWPFGLSGNGYGQVSVSGNNHLAHRVACETHHGPSPSNEHQVAHSCGNRSCISQKHLRWATALENAADRVLHGTNNEGASHGQAKLTDSAARAIFKDHRSQRVIAKNYGVTQKVICNIKRGQSYKAALGM